jgi:regulator of sigma E protease
MFESTLIFILFLGPLIFFHELGHFLFARLCGVRVETFSIGFGPKILKFRKGDTDYAVSAIPLGGYVKMFGEDLLAKDEMPEDQRQFAFNHKTKWQRFWIVFGGPLANFILAFVIYFFLMASGEKVPEVRAGIVSSSSVLHEMGLRSGDLITYVNDNEITSLDDLNFADSTVKTLKVKRLEQKIELDFKQMEAKVFLDEMVRLTPYMRAPLMVNAKSELYYIGLSEVINSELSMEMIEQSQADRVYLFPIKDDSVSFKQINTKPTIVDIDSADMMASLRKQNFYPMDLMLSSIVMDSAAEKAGLKKNDVIVAINNVPFGTFLDLREYIQKNTSQKMTLTYLREGKANNIIIAPEKKNQDGEEFYSIGIYPSLKWLQPQMTVSKPKNIFISFTGAIKRTWAGIVSTLAGFKKLVTGEVSLKSLGGPLSIGKVASDSFGASLSYFFRLMAIISINLGILNLLPIPVLDGGHIVFLIIETIKRGPINKKTMIIAQQVGLSMLLMLMAVALFNDFSRIKIF